MRGRIYKLFFCLVLALTNAVNVHAQFITLPDPAFADFIAVTYPSIVNASKQLDTVAAKTITGDFICNGQNISDATGLEYFEGVTRIELTGNNLTSLPDISKTTNLNYLAIGSNQISSLPPLNGLANLQRLYCENNNLTSIPSLSGMSNLLKFFCNSNNLTTLPDLTNCSALDHIICSDNKITSLPDLSSLVSLKRFLLTNNLLTSADFSMLPALQEVRLKYNRLTSFPIVTGLNLTELWVDVNLIDSIPDMSAFSNLSDFRVLQNNLTFQDILPLTSHPNFSSFQISPQNKIAALDTVQLKVGDSLAVVAVDTALTTNTYSWFKNNVLVATNTTGGFVIDSLVLSDNGVYSYEVSNSNPLLAGLVLSSKPLVLTVISCFDASQLEVSVNNSDCKLPISISIDESTIYGGVSPYRYTLNNIVSGETLTSETSVVSVPKEGLFDLQIEDQNGCLVELKSKIAVSRSLNCEPVFYPDLDGPGSSYYIESAGTARIYSKEARLIRELKTPAFWDGKNAQGEIMDSGVYMIIINGQTRIQLSLIRTN